MGDRHRNAKIPHGDICGIHHTFIPKHQDATFSTDRRFVSETLQAEATNESGGGGVNDLKLGLL
jgi:hypothetical protein